ncbi:hypothetical protein BH11PSE2_BH11PSE2_10710 [soil metagenome]
MRRSHVLAAALLSALTLLPSGAVFAQRPKGGPQQGDENDQARRRERDREFEDFRAPLPGTAAAGPCPYVKVLYDAARFVEFKDAKEASANVAYSGEIEGVTAACAYKGAEPITIDVLVTFSLGKGPQATSAQKDYSYWVAVTNRNKDVLAKEHFAVRTAFPAGQNVVVVSDRISGITIPRADQKVNGNNFEVLIGFDLTPQMTEFNRAGKRFRVDADGSAARSSAAQ